MKRYLNNTKNYLINIFNIFIDKLLCAENRRRNLTIIAALIVLDSVLLIASSFAYYENNATFPILHAVVGDIDSLNYDYVLRVYVENNSIGNNKTYELVNNIPDDNYIYSSYKCKNNSILEYDQVNKTTRVSISGKEVCNIYFDAYLGVLDE